MELEGGEEEAEGKIGGGWGDREEEKEGHGGRKESKEGRGERGRERERERERGRGREREGEKEKLRTEMFSGLKQSSLNLYLGMWLVKYYLIPDSLSNHWEIKCCKIFKCSSQKQGYVYRLSK